MPLLRSEATERLVTAREMLGGEGGTVLRGHLLPARDINFDAMTGATVSLPLSDPAYRSRQAEIMRGIIDAKGPTLVPARINHDPGAVGWVLDIEEVGRGIDVIYLSADPALGTSFPYLSGRWMFRANAQGQWEIASFVEVSHTDTPQFDVGQQAISANHKDPSVYAKEEMEIAASIGPLTGASQMTPEEIAALIDERIATAMGPMMARLDELVEMATEPEVKPEVAAAGDEDKEGAGENEEEVAASTDFAKILDEKLSPFVAKFAKFEKQLEVRASLSGQKHVPPAPAGRSAGASSIAGDLDAGFSMSEAKDRNKQRISAARGA